MYSETIRNNDGQNAMSNTKIYGIHFVLNVVSYKTNFIFYGY